MARRRKKKKHEDHIDESWLLPYSDLLTLLLALFIVLFASSSVDADKMEQMSKVFSDIFTSGTGVLDYTNIVIEDDAGSQNQDAIDEVDKESTLTPEEALLQQYIAEQSERESAMAQDQEELREIKASIDSYIQENELGDQYATQLLDEGLLLTIRDSVLFQSGSATVQPSYRAIGDEVARLLEFDPPRSVIISGHTDNVPIGSANFSSNWELSVMRAVNFMKIIIENPNLDPQWFSAKGFGEYQPIATNETEAGRAQNRRVEVLILPRVANKTNDEQ
ncbi:flagellar motor protein MotB [Jeotgalibacillus soli]|uniref:Flagellar motor protein MotB n=1 Tax=Jeotgalibacillus soli TaxID=889306 RepID=A0A0C2RA67_9BACL|nr:flagellar motor protein MotB [Jeotgalibacillus soli]KIL47215.1 flagellar motor protein MotB [Jeotgalibacillus soli]